MEENNSWYLPPRDAKIIWWVYVEADLLLANDLVYDCLWFGGHESDGQEQGGSADASRCYHSWLKSP